LLRINSLFGLKEHGILRWPDIGTIPPEYVLIEPNFFKTIIEYWKYSTRLQNINHDGESLSGFVKFAYTPSIRAKRQAKYSNPSNIFSTAGN
jgi:hypothetical protein